MTQSTGCRKCDNATLWTDPAPQYEVCELRPKGEPPKIIIAQPVAFATKMKLLSQMRQLLDPPGTFGPLRKPILQSHFFLEVQLCSLKKPILVLAQSDLFFKGPGKVPLPRVHSVCGTENRSVLRQNRPSEQS